MALHKRLSNPEFLYSRGGRAEAWLDPEFVNGADDAADVVAEHLAQGFHPPVYLGGIYHKVQWLSIPRRDILDGTYEDTHTPRDGESPVVGFPLRAVRARVAPAREGPRAAGLSEVQEPVLERPAQERGCSCRERLTRGRTRPRPDSNRHNPLSKRGALSVEQRGQGCGESPGRNQGCNPPPGTQPSRSPAPCDSDLERLLVVRGFGGGRSVSVHHLATLSPALGDFSGLNSAFQGCPDGVPGIGGLGEPIPIVQHPHNFDNAEPSQGWLVPQYTDDGGCPPWTLYLVSIEIAGQEVFQSGKHLDQPADHLAESDGSAFVLFHGRPGGCQLVEQRLDHRCRGLFVRCRHCRPVLTHTGTVHPLEVRVGLTRYSRTYSVVVQEAAFLVQPEVLVQGPAGDLASPTDGERCHARQVPMRWPVALPRRDGSGREGGRPMTRAGETGVEVTITVGPWLENAARKHFTHESEQGACSWCLIRDALMKEEADG